jgi:hypothetical protein
MPIEVKSLPKDEYAVWLANAKQEFASADSVMPAIKNNTSETTVLALAK